jgi:hypothetical protein
MAEKQGIVIKEILAGSGIGLLVGLLLGLSVSEVVGSVLSGLAALLGAFFGLYDSQKPNAKEGDGDSQRESRSWRIAAFGFICAFAVVAGILIRSHNLLSISIEDRIATWTQAGYEPEEAREIVVFQELGIAADDWNITDSAKTRSSSSALFSQNKQSDCDDLDKDRFASVEERAYAFKDVGAQWKIIAERAEKLDKTDQGEILEAAWELACK